MSPKVKVIHLPVETHGELAELVGRKKRKQVPTSMQSEVDKAVKKHIKIENNKLAS